MATDLLPLTATALHRVEARGVSVSYGPTLALRGVDATFEQIGRAHV